MMYWQMKQGLLSGLLGALAAIVVPAVLVKYGGVPFWLLAPLAYDAVFPLRRPLRLFTALTGLLLSV